MVKHKGKWCQGLKHFLLILSRNRFLITILYFNPSTSDVAECLFWKTAQPHPHVLRVTKASELQNQDKCNHLKSLWAHTYNTDLIGRIWGLIILESWSQCLCCFHSLLRFSSAQWCFIHDHNSDSEVMCSLDTHTPEKQTSMKSHFNICTEIKSHIENITAHSYWRHGCSLIGSDRREGLLALSETAVVLALSSAHASQDKDHKNELVLSVQDFCF